MRVLVALFIGLSVIAKAELSPLRAGSDYFYDAKNGVVILRGVNVSADFKTPPVMEKLKPEDLDPLPGWGVNSIRLLFNWETYEPVKGQYNTKYIDWYVGLVKEAKKRGLRVIVEFHQDSFSRYTIGGCGNGFPKWAVVGEPAVPDNGKDCADWGNRERQDPQIQESYDGFYANKNDVRSHYLDIWRVLAERFKNEPAVVGFDLINEPTVGDWNSQLLPLYTDAARIIHSIDPSKIIFVEPVAGRLSLGPGLTLAPFMKKPTFQNAALAAHYYDLQVIGSGAPWLGTWSDFTKSEVNKIADRAKKWNMPVWIGEFGYPAITGREEKARHYLEKLYGEWNEHFFSSAEWNYTPTWDSKTFDHWNNEDSSIVDDKGHLRQFRPRPYAERISGRPISMKDVLFEDTKTTKAFLLKWDNDPSRGDTIVFAPKSIFPPGAVVLAQPDALECAYLEDGFHLRCHSSVKGPHEVVIRVSGEQPAAEPRLRQQKGAHRP